MTDCVVICHQCVDETSRARRWDQNCELCAKDCIDTHRQETGHTDIELRVTRQFTADDVAARMRRRLAARAVRRGGWAAG